MSCGTCSEQRTPLADLHDQACALAASIGMGQGVEDQLSTTDVPPLSSTQYRQLFGSFQSFIGRLVQNSAALEEGPDLQRTMSLQVGHADDHGLVQGRLDAVAGRMGKFRAQLSG
eukprot:SAG22_NODE_8628_length_640_cov_1.510166_1_plen_114_part_10